MSKLLSKFKRNTIDEFINSVDNQKVSALAISARQIRVLPRQSVRATPVGTTKKKKDLPAGSGIN